MTESRDGLHIFGKEAAEMASSNSFCSQWSWYLLYLQVMTGTGLFELYCCIYTFQLKENNFCADMFDVNVLKYFEMG